MNRFVFLSGAVNSGKSTVGKILLGKCRDLAFVEVDALRGFVPWMPIDAAVPLNIRNGIAVSRNFLGASLDVVFAYPLSDPDFGFIRGLIDFECRVEAVTLYCPPEENVLNRGSRALSGYEIERIRWMHAHGLARPSFSRIVDTSGRTPEETAEMVIDLAGLTRK